MSVPCGVGGSIDGSAGVACLDQYERWVDGSIHGSIDGSIDSQVPYERWDVDEYYQASGGIGKMYIRLAASEP